jgi:uncharacterized repeat protein (TIGR03803 family)
MTKLSAWKKWSAVLVLCALTATVSSAQTLNTLLDFDGANGADPIAALVQGGDGNFYGMASNGGANDLGTVFKITPEGTLTTLYSFCAQRNCADGELPVDALLLTTTGNLYGTTNSGGANDVGTVFKITPAGVLTTLHSFGSTDGANPSADLIQANDGNFYGTTFMGGADSSDCNRGCGTVFKVTSEGALTTLHSFRLIEGANPYAGLIQATDGHFYGTTTNGGANLFGTIFRITAGGTVTTLYSFNNADGAQPEAGLIQATDGNFYGTTLGGGANSAGTVFKITAEGALTTLYSFCSKAECADGIGPESGLIQASDGNFYGTTYEGGAHGVGTIFEITSGGTLTTLHSFDGTDGAIPYGKLVQATTGSFYGTAYEGGSEGNYGTVYNLSVGLGPFVTFVRDSGRVGKTGPILGQGFTGTTGVTLNGISATFTVKSDTLIEATVPPGATTGYVTVTTPSGTLTSNVPFHVIP